MSVSFVTWFQFGILAEPLPAFVKFLITFSVALTASWFPSAQLHKTAAKKSPLMHSPPETLKILYQPSVLYYSLTSKESD
jgi:hypothetical protein